MIDLISDYLPILVGTVLVNNFVLVRFLGLCPFMGVARLSGGACRRTRNRGGLSIRSR